MSKKYSYGVIQFDPVTFKPRRLDGWYPSKSAAETQFDNWAEQDNPMPIALVRVEKVVNED